MLALPEKVELDGSGDRLYATYGLVNINNGVSTMHGVIDGTGKVTQTGPDVIWPGETTNIPVDYTLSCDSKTCYD